MRDKKQLDVLSLCSVSKFQPINVGQGLNLVAPPSRLRFLASAGKMPALLKTGWRTSAQCMRRTGSCYARRSKRLCPDGAH